MPIHPLFSCMELPCCAERLLPPNATACYQGTDVCCYLHYFLTCKMYTHAWRSCTTARKLAGVDTCLHTCYCLLLLPVLAGLDTCLHAMLLPAATA